MAKKPEDTQEAEASKLIAVTKGGEVIEIHPDAEADHLRLGWARV